MNVYQVMESKQIKLPAAPAKGGAYTSVKRFGGTLAYVSGCGPVIDEPISGKLGGEFTTEQGYGFARNCMLNVLAALQRELGDLNRVKCAVKLLCFVNSRDGFDQQPAVANGASLLLADIFGEENGLASRSAIGVNALPGNIPVEIEAIFELNE